jgi:hypothetical protein
VVTGRSVPAAHPGERAACAKSHDLTAGLTKDSAKLRSPSRLSLVARLRSVKSRKAPPEQMFSASPPIGDITYARATASSRADLAGARVGAGSSSSARRPSRFTVSSAHLASFSQSLLMLSRIAVAARPARTICRCGRSTPIFGGHARTVGGVKRDPNRCLDNGSIC